MTYQWGTSNRCEDEHEHMEDVLRHESKPLESYIEAVKEGRQ